MGRGTSEETVYIGSLFEKRGTWDVGSGTWEKEEYVKHIFAGSTRVCSETLDVGSGTRDVKYFHTDHLGSSSVITDKDGNKVSSYEYAPYGTVTRGMSDVGRGTNYLFTGKELDTTGLYFYGARYYDPQIGRFISADPTVQHPYDPQDLNRYAYCRNNPINYVDPSGLGWFKNLFKSFAKAFAGGFAGGLATAILFPFIGPLAFVVGGAIAGATTSALNGAGWQGILIGAGMGAVLGGGLGGLACAGHGLAAAVIGGAITLGGGIQAYQQGGWEGVANYGAGVAGGITGFATGCSVGSGISNALRSPTQSKQITAKASDNSQATIDAGQAAEGPRGAVKAADDLIKLVNQYGLDLKEQSPGHWSKTWDQGGTESIQSFQLKISPKTTMDVKYLGGDNYGMKCSLPDLPPKKWTQRRVGVSIKAGS